MILVFGFREVRCRCSSGAGADQRRIFSRFFRMPCDECIRARLRRFPYPCVRVAGRAGNNVRRLQTSFTIIRTVFRFVKVFPSPCMQKQARFRDYVTACFSACRRSAGSVFPKRGVFMHGGGLIAVTAAPEHAVRGSSRYPVVPLLQAVYCLKRPLTGPLLFTSLRCVPIWRVHKIRVEICACFTKRIALFRNTGNACPHCQDG